MASHPSARSVFMSVEEYLALPEEKPYLPGFHLLVAELFATLD